MSASPIFIVGANRSGTTLLRLLLNAHSRIAIPEELTYFQSEMAGVPISDWRSPSISQETYDDLLTTFLERDCAPLATDLDLSDLKRELSAKGPVDLRHPYQHVLERWADAQGKPRWGEKTPGNLFFVDILHEMFPTAQFIHVVRDPRDGVLSMERVDFCPDSIFLNAMSRHKHAQVATRMKAVVPSDHWKTIRYEDLVTDTEDVLQGLCRFLGEAFEPDMLSFHRQSERYMKAEAASSFNATATQPVTTTRMQKWTDQLSDREIAIIEQICGPEMQTHGYTKTHAPLPWTDWARLLVYWAYWLIQEWRHPHVREYTVKSRILARIRSRLSKWIASRLPDLAAHLRF
jgi:hypothetical protein